jgi:hypothetical protein
MINAFQFFISFFERMINFSYVCLYDVLREGKHLSPINFLVVDTVELASIIEHP